MTFDCLTLLSRKQIIIILGSCTLFILWLSRKLFQFFLAKELTMDFTKTKWARHVSPEALCKQGDILPVNLTSWFPLCQSSEIGVNKLKGVHVFGVDLVVFRSSTGKAHVMDAYCPHMGTYFPIGGKVVSDDIRCPFHGWTFNGQGQCTHVPGLEASGLPKAKILTWTVLEKNGLIMIWYDSNNEPPHWMPVENKDLSGLELASKMEITVNGNFTELIYNTCDYSHFELFHTTLGIVDPESVYHQNMFCRIMNKVFAITFKPDIKIGPEKHQFHFQCKFDFFVLGVQIKNNILIEFTNDGPYMAHWKLSGLPLSDLSMVSTIVPFPGPKFKFTVLAYSKPGLLGRISAVIFHRFDLSQLVRDCIIFQNKVMLKKPHFSKNEKELAEINRFLNQFFPKDKSLYITYLDY